MCSLLELSAGLLESISAQFVRLETLLMTRLVSQSFKQLVGTVGVSLAH